MVLHLWGKRLTGEIALEQAGAIVLYKFEAVRETNIPFLREDRTERSRT